MNINDNTTSLNTLKTKINALPNKGLATPTYENKIYYFTTTTSNTIESGQDVDDAGYNIKVHAPSASTAWYTNSINVCVENGYSSLIFSTNSLFVIEVVDSEYSMNSITLYREDYADDGDAYVVHLDPAGRIAIINSGTYDDLTIDISFGVG